MLYGLMGAVCVYTLFLMALARVALAVLLAIGPLFIVLLLFDGTKRFFEAWVAQLANYALVGVLAVLVASLLMTVVEAYAVQTAAKGAAILTVDALDMSLPIWFYGAASVGAMLPVYGRGQVAWAGPRLVQLVAGLVWWCAMTALLALAAQASRKRARAAG